MGGDKMDKSKYDLFTNVGILTRAYYLHNYKEDFQEPYINMIKFYSEENLKKAQRLDRHLKMKMEQIIEQEYEENHS